MILAARSRESRSIISGIESDVMPEMFSRSAQGRRERCVRTINTPRLQAETHDLNAERRKGEGGATIIIFMAEFGNP